MSGAKHPGGARAVDGGVDDGVDDGAGAARGRACHEDAPRALWVAEALEAHSGAFGVDVTFLLLGGAATVGLTLVLSSLLRRPGRVELIGGPPSDLLRARHEGAPEDEGARAPHDASPAGEEGA